MENKRTYEAMLKPLFDFVDIVVRGLDLPEDESIQAKARVNELVSNMRKSLRRSDNIIWAIQHIHLLYNSTGNINSWYASYC